MLRRTAFAGALAVTMCGGMIAAQPSAADPAPPVLPDVFSYMPVNPANYTTKAGRWFAFAGPAGVVCVLDNINGEYGCSGPLPGAPDGANLVGAGPVGVPTFATTEISKFAEAGPVNPLPPNTRLTYRQVACGVDDIGVVACVNSREQTGFVVGPTATYIVAPPPPPPPPPEIPAPVVPAPVAPPA